METGHKVSAVVHGGLILWVMLFDLFSVPDDAIAPAVTEVSLISAAELAALSAPIAPPLVPITPPPPPPPTPAPPPPQPIQPPPPVVAPPPPARPQAAVISNDPSPVDAALNAVQQQVDRVAPQAVAPSDLPEGRVDQAAIAPDPTAPPAEAQPAQEATARPAAATEIVTEATRISEDEPARRTATAPEVSLRPRARPAPTPTPVAQPTPPAPTAPAPAEPARPAPAESQTDATAEAVARALEEALSAGLSSALAEASGFESGPMSQGEIDRLRLAIEDCWNVGILSTDALQVVVTIGFEMTPDARPIASSIRQIQTTGGNPMAQLAAFDAGRRAIEECGINGYGLPVELFEQWRSVEIVFNPARMRTR